MLFLRNSSLSPSCLVEALTASLPGDVYPAAPGAAGGRGGGDYDVEVVVAIRFLGKNV